MEIGKKPYELANVRISRTMYVKFFDKIMVFHPEFQIISENKDFTKLMSTF